jgi:hypothetical protein
MAFEKEITDTDFQFLRDLAIGWDYGKGGPIPENVINEGKRLVDLINKEPFIINVEIKAWETGNITLIFSKTDLDDFLDVTITASELELYYRHEKGIGWEYEVLDEEPYSTSEKIIFKLSELFLNK